MIRMYSIALLALGLTFVSCSKGTDKRVQQIADCQCKTYKTILEKVENKDNASAIVLEEMSQIIQCVSPFIEDLKISSPTDMEKFLVDIDKAVEGQCANEKKRILQFNEWEQ